MKYFVLVGAILALAVGCGSKNDAPIYAGGGSGGSTSTGGSTGHSGSGNRAGSGGSSVSGGDAGAAGDDGSSDGLAPKLEITSPTAVKDPNAAGIVTNSSLQVLCDVTPSSAPGATLDTQTVKIQALDQKGMPITTSATASTQNPKDGNEYGALVSLVSVSNGPISFTCSVSDKSSPPVVTTTTLSTFYDQGPTITPISPLPNSPLSLKNKVLFKFSVAPAPLSAADKSAAVDTSSGKVTLNVANQAITGLAADPNDATTYSVNVDLNDPVLFPKALAGTIPVTIGAFNARGVQAKNAYTVDIDGTPPTITIVSPATGKVVGGHVTLEFTVADAQSGVDPATVNVTLNSLAPIFYDPAPLSGWSVSADGATFDYGFDSNSSEINGAIQVAVVIKAADKATNQAAGVSEQLYLDNQPPIVDLDPPKLQERRFVAGTTYTCSEPFDVLGNSPNDLSVVPSAGIYRGLVWDMTNEVDGEPVLHLAGTDQNSVILYAQPDASTPLLVAKHNTNNVCDDLNTTAVATPKQTGFIPVLPQGSSYYDAAAPAIPGVCIDGTDTQPPSFLCTANASDLTRVIDHGVPGTTEPVIYSVRWSNNEECTGQAWSLIDAGLPNGWICMAAIAKDTVGNVGISAPLRVCLNSTAPGKTPPACATSSTTPPTCTDGCTPPGHFVSTSNGAANVLDLPKN